MERSRLFNALEQADSLSQAWQCTTEIMGQFQVQYGGLKLEEDAFPNRPEQARLSWEWNSPPDKDPAAQPGGARWSAIYELRDGDRKLGIFYLERNVIGASPSKVSAR
jgi:hypothetical protein